MATKLIFEDEHYEMEVFINQFNKIAIKTESKEDENDYSVFCLENEDAEKLVQVLQHYININK